MTAAPTEYSLQTSAPRTPCTPGRNEPSELVPIGLKKSGVAYALLILIGGTGAHRFYLGQVGWALAFLIPTILNLILGSIGLVAPATFLAIGVLVLWIVDLFLMAGSVRNYNLERFGRPY